MIDSMTLEPRIFDFVLCSGGGSLTPGFDDRLTAELTMQCTAGTSINVVRAADARIDAWRGARAFLNAPNYSLFDSAISRAKWLECGPHYLEEHVCSNLRYGTSAPAQLSATGGGLLAAAQGCIKRPRI